MHWKPEHLSYGICIPPLTKNIYELTHEETETYFSWYMNILPQRIAYLSEICAAELKCDRSELDLSAESLRILWRWFLKAAKTETAPTSSDPRHRKQLTLQTEYILRDVGMYLGETFRTNHSSLRWGYYEEPRSDVFVNRPVIIGFEDRRYTPPFKAVFEPIHMARVQAVRIIDHRGREDDLFELYRKWEQFCVD